MATRKQNFLIKHFAGIKKAQIELGDLTVFIGPQASRKTLVLELIKLTYDIKVIAKNLKKHGFTWENLEDFLELYFGEGLSSVWNSNKSSISRNGKEIKLHPKGKSSSREKVFYIPAQRVLTLEDGWPRAFTNYRVTDPYVVKSFSEEIRIFLEQMGDSIFPIEGKLLKDLRELIDYSIFWSAQLKKSEKGKRRRLSLEIEAKNQKIQLPFMVWSAGQREFVPLLLGFYWLMPSGSSAKRSGVNLAIIEEPEMGLHPKAIEGVIIIILELLRRGYKVLISTHSSQILELIWFIQEIKSLKTRNQKEKIKAFRSLFQIKSSHLDKVWESSLKKSYKIFYFYPNNETEIQIQDISNLSSDLDVSNLEPWGGLLSFPDRVNSTIADMIAREK